MDEDVDRDLGEEILLGGNIRILPGAVPRIGEVDADGVDRPAEWGGRIPLVRDPADIRILVAGGPGKHSSWCPTFGATFSATRRI